MKIDDIYENIDLNGYTKEELFKALCICVMDLNRIWTYILKRTDFEQFYPSDFLEVIKEE